MAAERGYTRRRGTDRQGLVVVVEGFLSLLSLGRASLALPLFALDLGMGPGAVGVLVSINART